MRAVTAHDVDTTDAAVGLGEKALDDTFRQNHDVIRLGGVAQPINEFLARAARQTVHAQGRMTRVGEIIDEVEG